MNAPLLSLEGVSKTFHVRPVLGAVRRVDALRNVTFSIEPGKALALVGESGSGKSTCGRAVIRHFEPSAGTVRFRGENIFENRTRSGDRAYLRAVQMVFQDRSPRSTPPTRSATTSNARCGCMAGRRISKRGSGRRWPMWSLIPTPRWRSSRTSFPVVSASVSALPARLRWARS
nr:ATP-binding cassette domain-containing protein [Nitratireductor aquibiodomus]